MRETSERGTKNEMKLKQSLWSVSRKCNGNDRIRRRGHVVKTKERGGFLSRGGGVSPVDFTVKTVWGSRNDKLIRKGGLV